MTTEKSIEKWLARAWAEPDECPPPEIFLPDEWTDLDDATRQDAARHLETCAACAAESELARAFAAPPLANPRAESELDDLLRHTGIGTVAGSTAGTEGDGAPAPALRFPSLAGIAPRGALALAAAAVLVIAAGVVVRGRLAVSPLPDVPTGDITRSGRIELRAPVGEIEETPAVFDWAEVEGAELYRVTLSAVDESVLWTTETAGPPLDLPAGVGDRLPAQVIYFWRVEAYDAEGGRLAWSEPVGFRFRRALTDSTETLPQ